MSYNNAYGINEDGKLAVRVIGAGGGGGAVIDVLNVTPSTTAQTITASGRTDGYSPVNVAAVTSAIDANIVAENIKKDVSILGVTGTYAPTGTISITTNGTHDVTNYATADVQVPTTAPALYREYEIADNGVLMPNSTTSQILNFTGVRDVGDYVLYNAYYNNQSIAGAVVMGDLTGMSFSYGCGYAFYNCRNITSVNMPVLMTISGRGAASSMFATSGITSAKLPSLTTVSGFYGCESMFQYCSALTNFEMPFLTTISNLGGCRRMFGFCTALTNGILYSLTSMPGASACDSMFADCSNLVDLSFPSITPNTFASQTNQFVGMCQNIPNITLHFPSNTQAKIETLTGYSATAPFGATAGTVLFDLPATNTLTGADSNTYSRNPKYDTATSLAWKVGAYGTTDFMPAYYTSGTTDPAVSDTIYSDAECTQTVTTITAIA